MHQMMLERTTHKLCDRAHNVLTVRENIKALKYIYVIRFTGYGQKGMLVTTTVKYG
jgi:hypothetical protein